MDRDPHIIGLVGPIPEVVTEAAEPVEAPLDPPATKGKATKKKAKE